MTKRPTDQPDSTAIRVALWRAMHVEIATPAETRGGGPLLQEITPGDARPKRTPAETRGRRPLLQEIPPRAPGRSELLQKRAAGDHFCKRSPPGRPAEANSCRNPRRATISARDI